MKITTVFKIKYLILCIFLSGVFNSAFAISCLEDMDQMRDEILRHGSITTTDGVRFNDIGPFTGERDGTCYSWAFSSPGGRQPPQTYFVGWIKGDWGNTIHRVRR